MTVAEDNFGWQGSTALTNEKSGNPIPKLRVINGGNHSPGTPNYADDIEQTLDSDPKLVYMISTVSPTSEDFDYIRRSNVMQPNSYSSTNNSKMVPLDNVIQGGSLIVGSIATMSLVATFLSGAIIIQPLFAIALLIACVGFYILTLAKND